MGTRTLNFARLIIFVVFLATAFLMAWTRATHAEEAKVKIGNFTFDPMIMKVKAGMAVSWTNEDDIPHTVAAADHSFKSKPLDTGETYSTTFSTPGRYTYFCSLHPHMKGTIIVEGTASKK
jgi:plastocyanin